VTLAANHAATADHATQIVVTRRVGVEHAQQIDPRRGLAR